jgi:hypothetical protein
LNLSRFRERVERSLHGSLTCAKRNRQRRTGPRLTVGEESEYVAILVFDRPRQHHHFTCAARRQRKPTLRRSDIGQRPKQLAKPSDFDTQPHAMRFIHESRTERASKEQAPRNVTGPRLGQRACKSE